MTLDYQHEHTPINKYHVIALQTSNTDSGKLEKWSTILSKNNWKAEVVIEMCKNDAETMYDTVLINWVAAPLPDDSYLQQKLDIWHVDRSKRQRFDRNIIQKDICSHCCGYNLINSWTDDTHSCFLSTHFVIVVLLLYLFSLLSQYDCSWPRVLILVKETILANVNDFRWRLICYYCIFFYLGLMFMSNCRQT